MKTNNGGYCMIDLTGTDLLSGSKVTITGSYNAFKKAMTSVKPIIVSGIVAGDEKVSPSYASVATDKTDYVATVNTNTITVDSSDGVTVASLIPDTDAKTTKKK